MGATIKINAEDLRNFLKSLNIVTSDGIISLSEDGISATLVDPANILMGEFNIPAADMQKYTINDPRDVALRFDVLLDYIAGAKKNETVCLELDENELQIQYTGVEYTQRTLRIESVKSIPKIPNLQFNSMVKISTKTLAKSIKACTKINMFVLFETNRNELKLSADFEKDGVSAVIEDVIMDNKSYSRTMYSGDYLSDIMKGLNHTTDLIVKFSTDLPLRIESSLCKTGKMMYIIAPRIESD